MKNVNVLILSWGKITPSGELKDLIKNKDNYLAGIFLTPAYLIADCGHSYFYPGKDADGKNVMLPEKVMNIQGTWVLVKYRTLAGRPTHCHECARDLIKDLILAAENSEILFSTKGNSP